MTDSPSPQRDPALRVAATPADANVYGSIFGGWLLSLMDAGAGLIAARFARGRTATVAVDRIELTAPIQVGDEVSIYGSVTSFRRSSFVVSVEAWRRDRHDEDISQVGEAVFTFVALDESGRPRPLAGTTGESVSG